MRTIPVLLATALLAACNVSADAQRAKPSGENVTRDVQVGAFQAVTLAGPHDVIVTVGGAPAVRVRGDSGLIDDMDIKVENGTLRTGQKKDVRNWGGDDEDRVKVYVTVPALTAASVAGSGDLSIDRVDGGAFSASVAGSGDLAIGSLRVSEATFSVAGSGDIEAAGEVLRLSASVAGSGDIDASGLRARQADINIVGSGDVSVSASETATVNLMGSGDATVTGGARCEVNKRGSGEVRCG